MTKSEQKPEWDSAWDMEKCDDVEAVSLQMYAHWVCPTCKRENAEPMGKNFPVILVCSKCEQRVRTLKQF